MKQNEKKNAVIITADAVKEFPNVNKYGIKPYENGETIDTTTADGVKKSVITICNSLIYIAKVKRDHIDKFLKNSPIANYLDNEISILRYCRYCFRIDENGKINFSESLFYKDISETISEIDNGFITLQKHNGETMTKDIFKEISKDYGNILTIDETHKSNIEKFNAVSLDETIKAETETDEKIIFSSVFDGETMTAETIKNKELKNAFAELLKSGKFNDFDIDITMRIANGETQTNIAEIYETTQKNVSKHYHKVIEELRRIMTK